MPPPLPTQFSPSDIANLALWLDASSTTYVVLDQNGKVQEINDRSSFDRDIRPTGINPTPSRPDWNSTVRNSFGGFSLDASNDFLSGLPTNQSATDFIGSDGTETTLLFFGSASGGRIGPQIANQRTSDSVQDRIIFDNDSGSAKWLAYLANTDQSVSIPSITDGSFFCDVFRWSSGTKPTVRRVHAGTTVDYEASGTLTGAFSGVYRIFWGSGTTDNLQGFGCESIVYNRRLTDSEVTQLTDYIQGKWGEIVAPVVTYTPSLDFSDSRNSMYLGTLA